MTNQVVYLYLCDGKACPETDKKCCYTLQGIPADMTCRHTTNEEHAFAKKLSGLFPTRFDPFMGSPDILVEHFDYAYANKDKFENFVKKFLNEKKDESDQENAKD